MNKYSEFVDRLELHLESRKTTSHDDWKKESNRLVNGQAGEQLRHLVDLDTRREYGAFFTNSDLASEIITNTILNFGKDCKVYDPAVGAGNLLIAVYNNLITKTNKLSLFGTDLHKEFIKAAEIRLKITEFLWEDQTNRPKTKVSLNVANGLENNKYFTTATHIVTNPPFNLMNSDETILWGNGKVSAAAVFIDRIISYVKPGTYIIAILPDVLRSGSRYEKWRKMVDKYCTINQLTLHGQFDRYTDIDVFSIILSKKQVPENKINGHIWTTSSSTECVIEDLFKVSVGNVVDNRDPHEGKTLPFLISKGLPGWKTVSKITKKRKFSGRFIESPFVVVKRTSRMGDKHRAIATIVNTKGPVYVDNHLIVLKPKSEKLLDCELLIEKLKSEETDSWINEQIRCRHLTVKIVAKIPI